MAKRSSSVRASSPASSASTLSCINVAAHTRESSISDAACSSSTPPTSIPEESTGDASSIKQTESLREVEGETTRRSARPRSSIASYNLGSLTDLQHGKTGKGKGTRDFSGDTLVDKDQALSTETPQRQEKLAGEVSKALDLDWQIDHLPGTSAASRSPVKGSRRNSAVLDKMTHAAGKIKSALGKRGRDAVDSGKEMLGLGSKRSSGRLQKLEHEKSEQKSRETESVDLATREEDIDAVRQNKKPKLVSRFSEDLSATPPRSASTGGKIMKRYQSQGLYVGQAHDFDTRLQDPKKKRKSKADTEDASDAASTKSVTYRKHLPLPMFHALEREKDFTIPFDVFAPVYRTRGDERPKDWGRLAKNRFIGDAKELWRTMKLENSMCVCKPPTGREQGCGEDCINRALDYECDDSNCRLGDLCTNRAFYELAERTKKGNEYDVGIEVLKTRDRGFGVRANRSFAPGQIIMEYSGEVITQEECERRMREEYKDKDCYYLMTFDQRMIIDATRGSVARFVNHSCEPNCKMEKRTVAGAPRMALFAGPNGVVTGQELSYDYNFDPFSQKNVQACHCGTPSCRGVLGPRPKDSNNPRTKKEKEGIAAGLKRKAAQVFGISGFSSSQDTDAKDRKIIKKRKTVRLPIGWAYVDDEVEKRRLEEDRLEKGVPANVVVTKREEEEKKPSPFLAEERRKSRKSIIKRVETSVVSHSKVKKERSNSGTTKRNEVKEKETKGSLLDRAASVLKRSSDEPETKEEAVGDSSSGRSSESKEKPNNALRQSTLSFQAVTTTKPAEEAEADQGDKETLLTGEALKTNGSLKRAASSAKDRLFSSLDRRGSKRMSKYAHGTVRMVDAEV